MSNETELRDRLSQIIDRGPCGWDSDTNTSMTDTEYAAQAIIDGFSLRYETHAATENSTMRRVVGLWAWV